VCKNDKREISLQNEKAAINTVCEIANFSADSALVFECEINRAYIRNYKERTAAM
jgi:hypothetical protein